MNFSAINWLTRCFYLLSLLVVYLIKVPILYFYILFFFISVEVLLLKKSKSETKLFKFSQLFFIVFVSYVLFARAHIWGFSIETDYNLNTIEHIFFSLVICLLIYFYTSFYSKKMLNPIFLSVFIFNLIGIINEFFQNYCQEKPIFVLDEFSVKDLIVNALGSVVFILIMKFMRVRISGLNNVEK